MLDAWNVAVQAFVAAMPRVRPHYAIKCNSDRVMLRVLAALGCGFDCASPPDVASALAAGAAPEDIIFASTCKRPTDMRLLVSQNIQVRLLLAFWVALHGCGTISIIQLLP